MSLTGQIFAEIFLRQLLEGVSNGQDLHAISACSVHDAIPAINDLAEIGPVELRNFSAAVREIGEACYRQEDPRNEVFSGARTIIGYPISDLSNSLDRQGRPGDDHRRSRDSTRSFASS